MIADTLFSVPDPAPVDEPVEKSTERHILDALAHRYRFESFGARRYALAEHAPSATYGATAIADLVVVDCWRGRDMHPLLGHEVKVSRSDWLRELRDPSKALSWSRHCTRWYLVAPRGVLKDLDELPTGWGFLQYHDGGVRQVVAAPKLHPEPLPWHASVALMRAIQKTAMRATA